MGIPEDEAKYYEDEVRGGRTLVAVRAGERMDEADRILHDFDADDVEHRDRAPTGTGAMGSGDRMQTRATGSSRHDGEDERTVQLREEELRAEKRSVDAGRVTVGKDMVERQET